MAARFQIGNDGGILVDGALLDLVRWACASERGTGRDATAREVFQTLSGSPHLKRLVVGVIGPREATERLRATAEAVGQALGGIGVTVISGGRSGVMEAVCKGVQAGGGIPIGVLPGSNPDEANPFVGIPLPTGLGEARNMIIAKAARVLIAIGGSYGTLSEVAYGLHFSKRVIGLEGAPEVDGVIHAASIESALDLTLEALLASAVSSGSPDV